MGLAIGIDLGTTNTVVGAVVNGVAVTLADEKNRRLIPSIVSFTPTGQVLVGEAARERRVTDPKNSIYSVKRLIGRPFGAPEVQNIAERFPFSVVRGDKDATMVVAQGTPYALPEISAFVLRRAKKVAEAALGEPVDRAVVTVPANFNDLQRAATKLAGKLAGLEVLRILNEPTAAALAYGQAIEDAQKIAVYDLGGGTFDITLLDLDGKVFEVLSTAGDTALGGDDLDTLIAEKLADQLRDQHAFDARRDPVAFGRLRLAAEAMKRDLSVATVVEHEIREVVYAANGVPVDVRAKLTRMELEMLAAPLVERTLEVTRQSLAAARLAPTDFEKVILVGGSTRMPLIAKRVGELFAQPPSVRVNPDEVVALGAAIQAHALVRTRGDRTKARKNSTLLDSLPSGGAAPVSVGSQAPPLPRTEAVAENDARDTLKMKLSDIAQAAAESAGPPPAPVMPLLTFAEPDIHVRVPDETAKPSADGPGHDDVTVARRAPSLDHEADRTLASSPANADASQLVEGEEGGALSAVEATPAHEDPSLATAHFVAPNIAARLGLDASEVSAILPPTPPSDGLAPVATARATQEPESPVVTAPFGASEPAQVPVPELAPGTPRIRPYGAYVPPSAGTKGFTTQFGAPPVAPPTPPVPGPFWSYDAPPPGAADGAIEADAQSRDERERLRAEGGIVAKPDAALLVDVTPLSLLVETVGGYCDVLIAGNTPVPCDKTRVFRTAQDNQTRVTIRVGQGGSNRFEQNHYLGELELSGIRPGKRGEAAISVTFELDADGILNVKARDRDSGIETRAQLRSFAALTEVADVAAMMERQTYHEVL
jgi:molecular chaperone DnaK